MNKITGFIEQLELVLEATVKEFQRASEQRTASHKGAIVHVNVHIILC